MHLSWITSRGQHLLLSLTHVRPQESHDPDKNCRTNQQGAAILLEIFASNQSKKNTFVSFFLSNREAQLFHSLSFSLQQHCTENQAPVLKMYVCVRNNIVIIPLIILLQYAELSKIKKHAIVLKLQRN